MTPLQLGFFGSQAQLFPAETSVMGLRLNVFCSDNQDVAGFDVGVVGRAARMSAIQVNLVNIVSEEFAGIGVGLFNDVNSLQGIQAGLFNTVAHDVSGFQIGLLNNADSVSGIQVGLFNRTVSMQGLQIGFGILDFAEDAQGVMDQQFACLGQCHATAEALEQGQAGIVFQLLQLHRDGRRGQM